MLFAPLLSRGPARLSRRIWPRLVALGSMLAITAAWSAPTGTQWVWRDTNKQMHSSDLPPPKDVPDSDILHRPAPRASSPPPTASASAAAPGAAAASEANRLQAEVEARRAKAEQDERSKRDAEAKANATARAENCGNARRELAAVDSGQRMVRVNDKGEREYLDDAGRAAAKERARNVIDSDCMAPR